MKAAVMGSFHCLNMKAGGGRNSLISVQDAVKEKTEARGTAAEWENCGTTVLVY